jgi:hypothetical protein
MSPVGVGGDETLRAKLAECARAATDLLPAELARLNSLPARNQVERDAFRWKQHAVQFQLEQAARVATERLRLFASLKSEADYERERDRCRRDTLYWFRMYAWGYDPRAVLKVQPFYPYPRQEQYLAWLEETVFARASSGVVEKSRDEGATVGALDWLVKCWLFVPGFSAFLSSATEDLVDSSKDPNTLFEKVRFQLRLTPSWMLPKGFNLLRDMPYMNIANPDNGATIGGGAPTANVGRQRRATVVLADEFQSWPNGGFQQSTALSQTSYSVIKLGTPLGTLNQYYKDTHAPDANVFILDWHDNPVKDGRWYGALPFGYTGPRMTAQEIAQEVDRNYEASQPGRVWPDTVYRETHTVITVSELRAYLAQFGVVVPDSGDGRARLPKEFGLGRANDKGHTEGHRNAWLWCGRPREGMPLADSVFVYREWLAPLGSSHRDRALAVLEFERPDGETPRANLLSLNSHEAQGDRDTYKDYGLRLRKWTVDYQDGIDEITDRLTLVETDKPHPLRPELMGRPKIYLVCADGEGELLRKAAGDYYVQAATTARGLVALRRQLKRYHYPPEEEGKPVGQMRPRKIDDDLIDDLRAFATHRWPRPSALTTDERADAARPVGLRNADIAKLTEHEEVGRAVLAQHFHDSRREQARRMEEGPARPGGFINRYSFTGRR